jgi:hypothetical protein
MEIKIAKVVGTAGEKTWSQVHEFRPEADQPMAGLKIETHGQLIAALALKVKKEDLQISSFGTEIITRLQEIYYSNESESVLKKIEQTMESLKAEFFNEVELEIVMGVVLQVENEKIMYAGRRGGGQVSLKRGENLVALLNGDEEGGEVVSGKLKGDDRLLIGTSKLFSIVPEGSLRSSLELSEINEMMEGLAGMVHGHEKNSRAAGVIVIVPEDLHASDVGKVEMGSELEKSEEVIEPRAVPETATSKRLTGGIWSKLKEQIDKFQPRAVRVRGEGSSRRKSAATIVVVLLVLFGVSLGLAGRKRQKTKKETEYRVMLDEVKYKYDEAMELVELNPLRTKSLLSESKTRIEEYRDKQDGAISKELEEWLNKIDQSLGEASREYEVEEATEWFDFSLAKDNFKGTDWELEETSLLVWDEEKEIVVEVNLETKASKVVSQGEDVKGSLVGLAGERGFVVDPSGEVVTVVDVEDEKVVAQVGVDPADAGQGWTNIVDAVGFSSNLYLLDGSADGQIYKYLGVNSGISSQREYLTGDSYDMSEAVSMAIDGMVWVLFSDGTIVKYVRGVKDPFTIAGLSSAFQEPTKIFTSGEVDNLYVLDKKTTRVVVINKAGEYQSQYVWPGMAGVKDLVVSEELSKMYLLTGEKVFTIELK